MIVNALDLSLEKEWLKGGSLIVKSDSKVAISWAKTTCPWKLKGVALVVSLACIILGVLSAACVHSLAR